MAGGQPQVPHLINYRMTIEILYPSQCILGESPLWHSERNSCFWVDIEQGILYEINWINKSVHDWKFGKHISVVLEDERGNLILGIDQKLARFNFKDNSLKTLAVIEESDSRFRCNDGACDFFGNIWIGSMQLDCKPHEGSLYYLSKDLQPKKILSGLTNPNGIVWTNENERMYFIDSPTGLVKSYVFDSISEEISFERNAVKIPDDLGIPDGMTMDEQGMLWIAIYGGGCIGRWDPKTGTLIETINLPAPNVTNCAFAGENLDQLVITTSRENLSIKQLKKYPDSGNVFIAKDLGTKGMRSNKVKMS